MSNASVAERSKAKRIRAKKKIGKATPQEKAWLDKYVRDRGLYPSEPMAAKATTTRTTEVPTVSPAIEAPPIPDGHVPVIFDDDNDDDDDDSEVGHAADPVTPDRGGGVAAPPAAEGHPDVKSVPPPMSCGRPDCPRCSRKTGSYVCTTTNLPVWPPMNDEAAKDIALGVFGTISGTAMMIRKDHAFIKPTDAQTTRMGKAIVAMTYRRMNAVGAIDDILQFGTALVTYGIHVAMAPTPKKLPPPPEDT